MDLYWQEREVDLLAALLRRLDERSFVDVGAERGAFVDALLRAGSPQVHAIEPEPGNARHLRAQFADDPRVVVHQCAVAESDGTAALHRSTTPAGEAVPYAHTLLDLSDTHEIAWHDTVSVTTRSLGSLVEAGELPARVGVLKVDTEGSDLQVLRGLGALDCDVIMFEHWTDLPDLLGPCPWSIEDMSDVLRPRGFSHFACLEHRGEFAILKWNDADVGPGRSANVVFVHDRVLETLMPVFLTSAAEIAEDGLEVAERYAHEAHARLGVIEGLERERQARTPLGRVGSRIGFWMRPRLGTLHHHPPMRLRIPAHYADEVAPSPAPTISIVTPSFQQGRYLARTVFSVVRQNYPALEYIVRDGGSTDESIDVLRRFDAELTSWRSEPDGGQADAINDAFAETSGEVMGWLNADDLLLPGALAYVARYFAEHPDVDVVYGNRIMVDEDDDQIGAWIMPAHDDRALMYADFVPQETLFWRRRIWEASGAHVDPAFGYALDWDLLIRLSRAGARMVHLPRYLAAFRVHDAQKTTAHGEVGVAECDRLRQRIHGRPLSNRQVTEALKGYLIKSMLADMRQRVADRLGRRVPVETWPEELVPVEAAVPRDDATQRVDVRSA